MSIDVSKGDITKLPDEIQRCLVFISGRHGSLQFKPFDPAIVANQSGLGRPESDLESMFKAHDRMSSLGEQVLGIREEVRRRFILVVDSLAQDVVSRIPDVKTTWFGEYAKLMTTDEARMVSFAGRTAFDWAKSGKTDPEMVVKARNGYFYPASVKDNVNTIKG